MENETVLLVVSPFGNWLSDLFVDDGSYGFVFCVLEAEGAGVVGRPCDVRGGVVLMRTFGEKDTQVVVTCLFGFGGAPERQGGQRNANIGMGRRSCQGRCV